MDSELDQLALLGLMPRGVPIAHRIAHHISSQRGIQVPVGELDVALYRDDLSDRHDFINMTPSHLPFRLHNKVIVLVQDVLAGGRSIRAALNALSDYETPLKTRLAVLVHQHECIFPIEAQFVGHSLTSPSEVRVKLLELDGEDLVEIAPISSP
tara:strand:- start:220 stop:681 length:462 start_codon:yes stop_codon:yes gene_type:complete